MRAMYDWPSEVLSVVTSARSQCQNLRLLVTGRMRGGIPAEPFDMAMIEAVDEMRRRLDGMENFAQHMDRHITDKGYRMENRAMGDLDDPWPYVVLDRDSRVVAQCKDETEAETIVTALNCAPVPFYPDERMVFNQFFKGQMAQQPSLFQQGGEAKTYMKVPYGWKLDAEESKGQHLVFTVTDKDYCNDVMRRQA